MSTVFQIGCVVADIDRAEQQYAAWFGVPAWRRMPEVVFTPDRTTYRGQPGDHAAAVSLGYAGDLQIELIQPLRGVSLYSEFLDQSGPGIHHLGLVPDDYDAALATAHEQGLPIVQDGRMDLMEFAYLETPAMGAHFIELMRPTAEILEVFAAIKES